MTSARALDSFFSRRNRFGKNVKVVVLGRNK